MASVPVGMEDLEKIIASCAVDLIEKWAVETDIDDSNIAEIQENAVDTVAFIIDRFMDYLNQTMEESARNVGI